MDQRFTRAFLAVLLVAIGGAIGYFVGHGRGDDDSQSPKEPVTQKPMTAETNDSGAAKERDELARKIADVEAALAMSQREAQAARDDAAALRTKVAELESLAKQFQTTVRREDEDRARRVESLTAKLQELKKSDYQTFLKPGTLSDVIADIKALGDDGANALMAMLASETVEDRRLAAQLLVSLSDPRTIGSLQAAALSDEDGQVAAWASQALIRMDTDATVPALRDMLANSKHEGVKVNSLWGLCKHGDANGIERAIAYYEDENQPQELRDALGQGILILRGEKLVGLVDRVAKNYEQSPAMMRLAVNYYSELKSEAGRERLRRYASPEFPNDAIREMARKALEGN